MQTKILQLKANAWGSCNPEEKSNYITYSNANNLHRWGMSKHFPTSNFEWADLNNLLISILTTAKKVYSKSRLRGSYKIGHFDYSLAAWEMSMKKEIKIINRKKRR